MGPAKSHFRTRNVRWNAVDTWKLRDPSIASVSDRDLGPPIGPVLKQHECKYK